MLTKKNTTVYSWADGNLLFEHKWLVRPHKLYQSIFKAHKASFQTESGHLVS